MSVEATTTDVAGPMCLTRPECPICMLILPLDPDDSIYKSCCGKIICRGCAVASLRVRIKENVAKNRPQKVETAPCPFCRAEAPEDENEMVEMHRRRVEEHQDIWAMYDMGNFYRDGEYGLTRSRRMALKMYERAYDLGSPQAAYCIAYLYDPRVVGSALSDERKYREYIEEAARRGDVLATYELGRLAHESGNGAEAARHFMVAACAGDDKSLKAVGEFFKCGFVSREEYARTLRAYQDAIGEVKSDEREFAKQFRQSESPF